MTAPLNQSLRTNLPAQQRSQELTGRHRALTLGICVVNYFSAAMVTRLVESLSATSGSAVLRIACVDNSMSESESEKLLQTAHRARELGIDFSITRSPTNLGYAAGNNIAAKRLIDSGVNALLVVNPDVTVRSGALNELCLLIFANPHHIFTARTWHGGASYSGLSILNRWTSASSHASAGQPTGAVSRAEIVYPGGHFLAMSGPVWVALGGLSEDFFLFGEEADLTLRALRINVGITSTDRIQVNHQVGGTTGASPVIAAKSSTALRHASRSAVVFSRKHNSRRTPVVVGSRLAMAGMLLFRRGPTACGDVVRGVAAGLRVTLTPASVEGETSC